MSELASSLISRKITTKRIFLDPNNPRLIAVGRIPGSVPQERIVEQQVQESTYNALCSAEAFGIRTLKKSILVMGFLPIDRIVVRKIGDSGNYVVVEGNRRFAAIKWILKDYSSGELSISESLKTQLQKIPVLVLGSEPDKAVQEQIMIQGLRHISGLKEWGPYEQSLAVQVLLEMGKSPREAGEALGGLSATRVNRLSRALKALEAMNEDDEYGEYAKPDMFSYFEEIMRRPWIRDEWLKWNDESDIFDNDENLRSLYSWITPSEALDNKKKIPMAIQIRDLSDVLQDSDTQRLFVEPTIDITEANAHLTNRNIASVDWRSEFSRCSSILSSNFPMGDTFSKEDVSLLENMKDLMEKWLEQIRTFVS